MEKIMTEKEIAEKLGLSYWTIRKWRLEYGLPHFKTAGRVFYRLSTVDSWLAAKEATCQV